MASAAIPETDSMSFSIRPVSASDLVGDLPDVLGLGVGDLRDRLDVIRDLRGRPLQPREAPFQILADPSLNILD